MAQMSSVFRIDDSYGQGDPLSLMPEEDINLLEELANGTSIYGLGEPVPLAEEILPPFDFYENLAERAKENNLGGLAQRILKGIQEDAESRREWERTMTLGKKYLGLKLEEFKSEPFAQACAAVDATMLTALIRSYATAKAELFPAKGPVSARVDGPITEAAEQVAEDLKTFGNYYLTEIDKPYYEDSQRLLLNTLFEGTGFRKVYQDPVLNRPIARFVKAEDLLINVHTTSILESSRITQILRLSRKDINIKQAMGFYRNIDLPDISEDNEIEDNMNEKTIDRIDGIDRSATENRSLFKFYESYVDLDVDDAKLVDDHIDNPDGIPMPYIVTLCDSDRKIYAIRRNWSEGDPTFARKINFNRYFGLPGFGIYGIGLIQLIGNAAIVNTAILRMTVDAGMLQNHPGGIKSQEVKGLDNNKPVGLAEWVNIETGGKDIRQVIMSMAELYRGPSIPLMELRKEMAEAANILASTGESKIAETNANAPVGTTLALLEVEARMSSAVLSNLHVCLSNELQMLFDLFREHFDQDFEFSVPGRNAVITREHFNGQVKIIPVSDPTVMTSTQRIMRCQTQLMLAESYPQIYDMREVHRRMHTAIGTENIDALMPPPQEALPLDPITENMNAMLNKPLKAAEWQNHPSHIVCHDGVIMDPNTSPQAKQALIAHRQEHVAMQYLIDMQMTMNQPIPPLEQLQEPEMQNQLALAAAEATHQRMAEMQAQMNQNQPISKETLLQLDIEQKKEQAELSAKSKEEELEVRRQEAELEAELEAFKSESRAEIDRYKLEIQQQMAEEKNQVEMLRLEQQERIADEKNRIELEKIEAIKRSKSHE